ncbi:hypothetical protein [Halothece sp. PCC 7418]|uniref:hypothetical protein n=1 Tax=Halothece sp. (strain PCC 7418) TaxID=65093 RepID=UPI0012379C7E|nr:hypothetical protein [Halothece sp. PCC 7418]
MTSRPLPRQWRNQNQKKTIPLFVRVLLLLQRTSGLVALGAIALSLIMYGLQFRNQQVWNQEYEELQRLQRYERNVIGINEALKEQIALSGSTKNQGWVTLTPDRNIYLEPAPVPETEASAKTKVEENLKPPAIDRPIAY